MEFGEENEMFRLAADFINLSEANLFVTGKAGTGKTTFLKYIRKNCHKQMAVVAPTGVAAVNAGGVTIHSFFQLPLSPFIPEWVGVPGTGKEVMDRHSLINRLKISNEKKKVLQLLELLIIDEISMVRCDILDAIDAELRFVRKQPDKLFGGVQLLLIGDMFQLPPVIKDQEWRLLGTYYESPYFFDSRCIQQRPPVCIEFTTIYRQTEQGFIGLLNQVRNNILNEEGRQILAERFKPVINRRKDDGYIILTTHNEKARGINKSELDNIDGQVYTFDAEIKDDFTDNTQPADQVLQLKVGAQVMFIKNDTEKGKRYYNGKIALVTRLEEDRIFVQCRGESNEIEVKKEKWENIRYIMNKTTRLLEEEVLGSFTQYPLRLAWAITIHKSQGLTFEKAIIDAGDSFAPGQVYVALSRCTNLKGMILQSRIHGGNIFSDPRIVNFSKRTSSVDELREKLSTEKKSYQQSVILSIFDFDGLVEHCNEGLQFINFQKDSINPETAAWLQVLLQSFRKCQEISEKFKPQLLSLIAQEGDVEENTKLRSRLIAACKYFDEDLRQAADHLRKSPAVTDSTLVAKEYNERIKDLYAELSVKRSILQNMESGFNLNAHLLTKNSFNLPPFYVNAYAGASQVTNMGPHPELQQQLRRLRNSICSRRGLPVYLVAGSNSIDEMACYLPQTLEELARIHGFGPSKIEKYGLQFLEIIVSYCNERGLSSLMNCKTGFFHKANKRSTAKKTDTKAETLNLYKQGKSVAEIMKIRKLKAETIESHLTYFIRLGELNVEKLIGPEKLAAIESVISELKGNSLTILKGKLGAEISFTEIKMAVAWQDFQNRIEKL